jgi:hypothetical protein
MRRFATIGECVRTISRVGAVAAAVVLVGSGCQAITGSFTVQPGPGTVCASLLACCASLSGSENATCASTAAQEDEQLCAALEVSLGSACTPSSLHLDAGGPVPDAQVHSDGAVQHVDTGAPADLNGTWTLTGITCEGSGLTLDGTTTLTFETGAAQEAENLSDGCVRDESFSPVTISSTTITATDSTVTCSSSCTTSDCTAGSTGGASFPYTLSAGTLTLSESVPTTTCASGTILFNFSME